MDASWVAGHLTGGLGNRLFQHAAAAGLAEKLGRPLVFHVPSCGRKEHGPLENIFRLFPEVPQRNDNVEPRMLREQPGGAFTYDPFPDLSSIQEPLVIDGWRQTARYFPSIGIHAHLEEALQEERRKELLTQFHLTTLEQRNATWFVHIRLGDYLILPHHQIDIGSYYRQALAHVPADAPILLFSDQASEYESYFRSIFQRTNLRIVTTIQDELETLFLMSQCWAGAIVANSTFSWWGSYFARQRCPHPDLYKAVFPTCWGKGLPDAKDVIPPWGIRINTSG